MKTYIRLLPGILLLGLILGCSSGPKSEADSPTATEDGDNEPDLGSIIKPGVSTVRSSKAPASAMNTRLWIMPEGERVGRQEFGLAPVAPTEGAADLAALTAALRTYVADRMVPANSVSDLGVLVQERFVMRLPAPPPGMKYTWDHRLNVSLTANN